MERTTLPRGRQPCATAHPGPRHRRQRDRPRRQVRQPDRHQGPASRPRIAAALPWCSCWFLSWPFSSRPASPKMPPAPNVRPERRCAWAWICRSGHHVQADRSPGIWHDRNGSGLWHWPAGPDHRLRPGSWAPVWPALVLGHADAAAAWRSVVPERRWSFQLFCLKDPRGKNILFRVVAVTGLSALAMRSIPFSLRCWWCSRARIRSRKISSRPCRACREGR